MFWGSNSDVIVVGAGHPGHAGHAGYDAAAIVAKLRCHTLLITENHHFNTVAN